jgi:hypothetical protein
MILSFILSWDPADAAGIHRQGLAPSIDVRVELDQPPAHGIDKNSGSRPAWQICHVDLDDR